MTQLWPRLHEKLLAEVFDAGESFCFHEETGALVVAIEEVLAAIYTSPQGLKADTDVWLIDHAWTYRADDARAMVWLCQTVVAWLTQSLLMTRFLTSSLSPLEI